VAAGPEETKNLAGECPPPDSDPFSDAQFAKCLACLSRQFAASADRRFNFQKRRQFLIRVHNETLSSCKLHPRKRATIPRDRM